MFDISSCLAKSKYYDDSNKLVVGKVSKMKDGTGGVAIKEFGRLKPKIYLFLVDDNSVHKKGKGVNNNVVARISHSEYNNVLFSNKRLRHSVNRIQSINHKIGGIYKINKLV